MAWIRLPKCYFIKIEEEIHYMYNKELIQENHQSL